MSVTDVNIADPAKGLCAYLATMVGPMLYEFNGRPAVFRPKLPQEIDPIMPAPVIVVHPSGGGKLFGQGRLPIFDAILDVVCYGTTDQECYNVATATSRALRALTQSTWEGVKLYSAKVAGGPVHLTDAQTIWPATWLSTQLLHAEVAEF